MCTICDTKKCVGCEACKTVCPTDAISMKENEKGFLYPAINDKVCISCNLCKKVCPENNYIKSHEGTAYAAYSLNENVRKNSSSGGIFSELAIEIIKLGGYVSGAAFDDNKILRHVIINSLEDLKLLIGSKYIQSQIGDVFKNIKDLLEQSKMVLFSGTPCQIAGLKNYLQKEYDNLYTVDVFCHGVPSPLVFKKYMEEKQFDLNSDILFRDKTFGWSNYNFKFDTKNGLNQTFHETDTFFRGFISNLFLRESCYSCKYNNADSRQADISIGDFWLAEQTIPEISDDMGISAIIVYSEKGNFLFNSIKNNIFYKETDLKNIVKGNPNLSTPSSKHPKSELFYKQFKKDGVINTIERLLEFNKNVAILNHSFAINNYGAMMVAYSMEKIVSELGYHPYTIQMQVQGDDKLADFKNKFLHLTEPFSLSSNLYKLNKYFETFIVGSDQVWRNWWNNDKIIGNFFLAFANRTKNLIAYGASFGIDKFEGSIELKEKIKKWLRAFSAISVREEDGIYICKKDFDADAKLVLDPTLLIDKKEYIKIINSENLPAEKNYLAYMIFPDEEFDTPTTYDLIEKLSEKLGLSVQFALKNENTVAKWLNIFKNADFVITDSFHGMMFSIIFEKQFICFVNKQGGAGRFVHIAQKLGLDNRIFYDTKNVQTEDLINNPIDYEEVNKKISALRKESVYFLQKALSCVVEDNGRRNGILNNPIISFLLRTSIKRNKIKFYLFGFLPLLKIKQANGVKKYYLFHFIPCFAKKI